VQALLLRVDAVLVSDDRAFAQVPALIVEDWSR
jgi:predicted nucleic acid-binding protein